MPVKTDIEQHQSSPERSEGTAAGTGTNPPIFWICAGLAALTFAVYARTLQNGFISYDDFDYITANPLVRQGLSWHGIAQAFTTTDQANWFPMEWISLMATSQFFGLNAAAYHFTNLALHTIDTVLLFLLLTNATGRVARSGVVAALFAVLPLNVEAVAWATERKSVLSMFFLLIALFGYGWYSRKPSAARYIAVAVPLALGLMTKAWLVSVPFALLLLDYWPLERFGPRDSDREGGESLTRLVLEKVPLYLLSFASVSVAVFAARRGGAFAIATAHAPFGLRVENAVWSYLSYVMKGVWPTRLAIIYPFPQHLLAAWKVSLAAIFLVGVTVLTAMARERRYLIVGWLWYLGVLFPVIGLVQTGTQSMADRWAYVSFLGLFTAVVWGLADALQAAGVRPTITGAVAAAVVIAYAALAFVQAGYWRNSFTVFAHAVEVVPANGPARVNLGVEYERANRPDLAMQQYEQAVVDTPNLSTAHYNLALMLEKQQRPIEAADEYRLTMANTNVAHEIAQAHTGLGTIYFNMGLTDKAIGEFSAALNADSTQDDARIERGIIEYRQGNLEAAREDFTRSSQQAPTPMTWYTLGLILEAEKNFKAAGDAYQAALQMNPALGDAKEHLKTVETQSTH